MGKRRKKRGAWMALFAAAVLGVVAVGAYRLRGDAVQSIPPQTRVSDKTLVTGASFSQTQTESSPAGSGHVSVAHLSQAGYPTGCESASAVMLLRFYGVAMDMDTFIDEYLDCGDIRVVGGKMVAPHPNDKFVGDPRSNAAYGCYAPVIVRAVDRALSVPSLRAVDESGATLPELCERYIDRGAPVMVWATTDMKPSYAGNQWTLEGSGETFTWTAREHCLLLIGYDEDYYYFNDPMKKDGGNTAYLRALVEARYEEMGRQAVGVAG